jgi:hypothetical protein
VADLVDVPVVEVGGDLLRVGQQRRGVTDGADHPRPGFELVGAQPQDRVVELAGHGHRVVVGALGVDAGDVGGRPVHRTADGDLDPAVLAVDLRRDVGILERVGGDLAVQRRQGDAAGVRRAVRGLRAGERALADGVGELAARDRGVDELPVHGGLAAHALGAGGEDVGAVLTDLALVDDAGETAGARQHREQRHLGQRDRRGTVVDQQDLVAGQRELVAAAGRGAVDGGEVGLARVLGGVLDAVAGLVGELAEVHLPRVRGLRQHPDVRPRAEDLVEPAGDHDRPHLGVLEAQPLDRVVQLDVDAEVVGVELELVPGDEAAVLGGAELDGRDRPVELQRQVTVGVRARVERDDRGRRGVLRHGNVLRERTRAWNYC